MCAATVEACFIFNTDGGNHMKGVFFYAFLELKRRTADFLASEIIMWVSVFTAISFWHVIGIFSKASDETEARTILVLFEAVLLLILTVCGYMVMMDRFKRHGREYAALRECGLSEGGFFAVQSIQALILLIIASITATPAAWMTVSIIVSRYNLRISEYDWLDQNDVLIRLAVPDTIEMDISFTTMIVIIFLVILLTLGSAGLACFSYSRGRSYSSLSGMRKRSGSVVCDGTLLRANNFKVYLKVAEKRLGKILFRANMVMSICFALPLLLMFMGTSFSPAESAMDYVISTDTIRNPIPESLADALDNMTDVKVTYRNDGTEIYEKLTKSEASEEKYSFIHLTITSDHPEAAIKEIGKKIENRGFEFSAPVLSIRITNIKYSLLGDYFYMLSVMNMFCAVFVAIAIAGDYFRYRSSEVKILEALGVDNYKINKVRFLSGMRFILLNFAVTVVIGCAVYVPVAVNAGEKHFDGMLAGFIISLFTSLLVSSAISLMFTVLEWRKECRS